MENKLQELKNKRDRLFAQAVNDDPNNQDLLDLDNDLDIDKFNYNSYESRFRLKMDLKDITFTGTYETYKSILQFTCGKCDHKWDGKATKVQQDGCPKCKQFDKNLEKTIKIWNRTKQIVRDKGGKIINIPTPGDAIKLKDNFILKCKNNHTFTFTHLKLRDNQWCPVCKAKYGKEIDMGSGYTYRRGMTEEEKFTRYTEIAEIKGAHVLNLNRETGEFKIICDKCSRTRVLTPRQLCTNQYLCLSKCLRGHTYTLSGNQGA